MVKAELCAPPLLHARAAHWRRSPAWTSSALEEYPGVASGATHGHDARWRQRCPGASGARRSGLSVRVCTILDPARRQACSRPRATPERSAALLLEEAYVADVCRIARARTANMRVRLRRVVRTGGIRRDTPLRTATSRSGSRAYVTRRGKTRLTLDPARTSAVTSGKAAELRPTTVTMRGSCGRACIVLRMEFEPSIVTVWHVARPDGPVGAAPAATRCHRCCQCIVTWAFSSPPSTACGGFDPTAGGARSARRRRPPKLHNSTRVHTALRDRAGPHPRASAAAPAPPSGGGGWCG